MPEMMPPTCHPPVPWTLNFTRHIGTSCPRRAWWGPQGQGRPTGLCGVSSFYISLFPSPSQWLQLSSDKGGISAIRLWRKAPQAHVRYYCSQLPQPVLSPAWNRQPARPRHEEGGSFVSCTMPA